MKTAKKIIKIFLWVAAAALFAGLVFYGSFRPDRPARWGVTFSSNYASFLGLDWKEAYLSLLDDIRPQRIRLMAYWENIEPERGKFDFSGTDFLLKEAETRGISVLLVVGNKQPRWPECHQPEWAKKLTPTERQEAVVGMIKQAVSHFRTFHNIAYWQVENEPLFSYGPDCPTITAKQLASEIDAVRSLDARPVVVTDSGEKGWWLPAARSGADIFGATMYRQAYYEKEGVYKKYHIPAFVYGLRAGAVRVFSKVDRFMGVELQAEPWFATDAGSTSWEDQKKLMNPELFAENLRYADRAGFGENYLWGAEWWYWAKLQGHGEMWQAAKNLFNKNQK